MPDSHPAGQTPRVCARYWIMQSGVPRCMRVSRSFIPRGRHAWQHVESLSRRHVRTSSPVEGMTSEEVRELYADVILSPLQLHDSSSGAVPDDGALLHRGTVMEIPAHLLLTKHCPQLIPSGILVGRREPVSASALASRCVSDDVAGGGDDDEDTCRRTWTGPRRRERRA